MRSVLRPVALGAALMALPSAARGGGSDACPSARPALLLPGTHQGKLAAINTYKGGEQLLNQVWALVLDGRFTLEVDEDGRIKSAGGTLDYSFGGAGGPKESEAQLVVGLGAKASGPMKFLSQTDGGFKLKATLSGTFAPFAESKDLRLDLANETKVNVGPTVRSTTDMVAVPPEDFTFDFQLDKASCGSTSGTFESALVSGTTQALQAEGFQASPLNLGFTLKGPSTAEAEKEVEEVRKKVAKALALQARPAADSEMAKIKEEIQRKHRVGKPLRECLMAEYRVGVYRLVQARLDEDILKLLEYQGEPEGLESLMRGVVESDSRLFVNGVDRCDKGLHKVAYDAIDIAYRAALDRAYQKRRPAALLDVRRSYMELVDGEVAPGLEQQILDRLAEMAKERLDKLHAEMKAILKSMRKRVAGGDPTRALECNPARKKLVQDLLAAGKQCALLSVPDGESKALEDVGDYLALLTTDDVVACSRQARKKNVDDYLREMGIKR